MITMTKRKILIIATISIIIRTKKHNNGDDNDKRKYERITML